MDCKAKKTKARPKTNAEIHKEDFIRGPFINDFDMNGGVGAKCQ